MEGPEQYWPNPNTCNAASTNDGLRYAITMSLLETNKHAWTFQSTLNTLTLETATFHLQVCRVAYRLYIYAILIYSLLRMFAQKFSNIDFFSETFTTVRWWVSCVRNVKKMWGHQLHFGENMPGRTPSIWKKSGFVGK